MPRGGMGGVMKRIKQEVADWWEWLTEYDRVKVNGRGMGPYWIQIFQRLLATCMVIFLYVGMPILGIIAGVVLIAKYPPFIVGPVAIATLAVIAWLIARKGPPTT